MHLDKMLEALADMIRIDSRNTLPLEAEGERIATEQEMGEYTAKLMKELGFAEVEFHYIAENRPNVVGIHYQDPNFPCLAFEAHLDTVGTEGMSIDPFDPQIKDDKIFGRGSCDTKGSLVAMLFAAKKIIEEKLPINLLILATSAEETGCQGAEFWDLSRWNPQAIIIGEPTQNQPVIAHKSHLTFELICRGKAAHGSRPEAGDNAILKAAKLLLFIEKEILPRFDNSEKGNFERGNTLSIGTIKGGSKPNIVPDFCSIYFDMRITPCSENNGEEILNVILKEAEEKLGFNIELGYKHISPAMKSAAGKKILSRIEEGMEKLSLPCKAGTVAYCTDGGVLSQKGYTCIILGPGDILNAHAAVEFLEIEQLKEAAEIYLETARQIALKGL